ncbi:MAG: hypothetical protein IT341_04570 [Chloroflexi bacterium]|nr:hypothetical protein [Chloroflexota bacterium]
MLVSPPWCQSAKRVDDPDAGDRAPVLEVLGEEARRPGTARGADDQPIPEPQPVALLQLGRYND